MHPQQLIDMTLLECAVANDVAANVTLRLISELTASIQTSQQKTRMILLFISLMHTVCTAVPPVLRIESDAVAVKDSTFCFNMELSIQQATLLCHHSSGTSMGRRSTPAVATTNVCLPSDYVHFSVEESVCMVTTPWQPALREETPLDTSILSKETEIITYTAVILRVFLSAAPAGTQRASDAHAVSGMDTTITAFTNVTGNPIPLPQFHMDEEQQHIDQWHDVWHRQHMISTVMLHC